MKKKRIVLDVHEKLHEDVKRTATDQGKTIKEFLLDMIVQQLLLYQKRD